MAIKIDPIINNIFSKNALKQKSKQLASTKVIESLPLVITPIVFYKVNGNKVVKEANSPYKPYTKNIKRATREFQERGLTCQNAYIDKNSGNLNIQGNSILKNYDANKAKFEKAGLNFSNDCIDASTGKLNTNGNKIWNTYEKSKDILKDNGVPDYKINDYINNNTGAINNSGKKAINFKGSEAEETRMHEDTDLGNTLVNSGLEANEFDFVEEYITPEMGEIGDIDVLPGIEDLGLNLADFDSLSFSDIAEILDNPALGALAAEILPGTKFLRPLRDLQRGDGKKAVAGALFRTGEIAVAPVKLLWTATGALNGLAFKLGGIEEEGFSGLIGGAKYAAESWSKGRDILENGLIGRENPESDLTPEQAYERYKKTREEAIKTIKEKIAQEGVGYRDTLSKYFENSLKHYKSYNDTLEKMIEKEAKRQDYYSNFLAGVITGANVDTEYISKDLAQLQNEQKELQANYKKEIARLESILEENASEEKIAEQIKKSKLEIENYYNARNQYLMEEISRINKILDVNDSFIRNKGRKGFQRIAGYENEKDFLYEKLIRPAKLYNAGEPSTLPNLVLLHGPKGCGKTILANSLKDEIGCNVEKLRLSLDSDKDLENLQETLNKGAANYNQNGCNTIIRIEEIDGFLLNASEQIKDLISNIAEDYNCTIVATTNHPEKINSSLIPEEGFESLYVEPANKKNIAKVLRYYMKNFADTNFDYKAATDILLEKFDRGLYSNASLENFVKEYIKSDFIKTGKFNAETFMEKIKTLEPDIRKDRSQYD